MDGDGLSDGTEATTSWTVNVVGQGGRVVWSDPLDADRDRDGLNDASEKALGSDPNNADSDGDGALDGLENVRITNILEPDYLVTVFYRGLQAGKGTASANSDCDDGSNPGDFYFYFQVGRPTASGALSFETVVTNASVAVRDCENGGDGGPCRNTDNGYIRLASPQKLRMNEPSTFAVPFTDLFTIEGQVQEIDPGGADLTYDFGGIGTPDGSYRGSQLELGAFDVAFNDPPLAVGNRACLVEVTVQVKVE